MSEISLLKPDSGIEIKPALFIGDATTILKSGSQQKIQIGVQFQGQVPFSPDILNISLLNPPTGFHLVETTVPFAPHYGAATFTLIADAGISPGTYTLMLTASGSGYSASSTLSVTVTP